MGVRFLKLLQDICGVDVPELGSVRDIPVRRRVGSGQGT